ncbi:DUF1273 domain-containing protein [Lysinibacillus telephonicus]|uniref:DUF1273 domain-containing protein n=1 Tax=Lysinibacillus telephonicus TaxID=1714840 RepID=UPI00397D8B20
MKTIYVSGYRPHELGIFNDKHPGIPIIKKAIENELRVLLDNGLEWVVISGQPGVETWTAEVIIELKNEYPNLKYSVITPFLEQEKNWNEQKQQKFHFIIGKADFVTSVTKRPYEAPWQFIEKDKFIISNTDGLLLVYDEENEASPKYVKSLAQKYADLHNYKIIEINAYGLQVIAEEMQREEW